ncbi:MAG: hypothetical protein IJP12_02050 [Methanobrevibacter sp.]|nr:hypothetical protein [Methanobrevibacter sp.]
MGNNDDVAELLALLIKIEIEKFPVNDSEDEEKKRAFKNKLDTITRRYGILI